MTEYHGLDDTFPAGIDDCVEHDLRQLFDIARAPGATDELAGEAAVVASMSEIVHCQTAIGHVTQRRGPLRRVVGSRAAKVATITGFVVVLTSAAVAAGVVPQPVQSVLDRAARIGSRQNVDRDEPGAAVRDDPVPTAITGTTEVPDVIVSTTMAAYTAIDQHTDAHALCGRWATSIRSGVELEADAKLALAAMAVRAGAALERLCGPAAAIPDGSAPSARETPPPETVPPPTVSPVDTTVAPTDTPPASTNDGTPQPATTLPSQANGNGPSVGDPSSAGQGHDAGANGTPNTNANANADGSGNSHGGNPNANPKAAGATGNGNDGDDGVNGNASGGNPNSNGGNGNGND